MTEKTKQTVQRCRDVLSDYYGPRLDRVIVHGSAAQEQANHRSDIDLLVILRGPFEHTAEVRRIVELLYPVQLDTDRLISAKPAAAMDFERGTIQLYRNAKSRGLAI